MSYICEFFSKVFRFVKKLCNDKKLSFIDLYITKFYKNKDKKIHRDNDLPTVINATGDKLWENEREEWHRDNDLPAVEFANGTKYWFVNGKCHRDNGLPAIDCINGDKWWIVNGERHRIGILPAVELASGYKAWYIYDRQYTYEEVCNYYKTLTRFGRYCLKKIRMRRLRRLRWIHGELLCMPAKGSYPGGQDYHKMVSYFMSM
jgi:hypothetical protein